MKIISKHETEDNKGFAHVIFNPKENLYEIQFYDNNHHLFYTKEKNTLKLAQKYADDWAYGKEKIA